MTRTPAQPRVRIAASRDPFTARFVERFVWRRPMLLPYFTKELFTQDGRGVLVSVQDADKHWRPCLLDPDSGRLRRVCDAPMLSAFQPAIGGQRVVYIDAKRRLGWAPVAGGRFNAVSSLQAEGDLSEVCASSCGRYAVLAWNESFTPIVRSLKDGRFHSAGSERYCAQGRGVLLRIDLDTGLSKGVTGRVGGVGHPMISPADPDVMEFCDPSGPWQQVQRMYAVHWHPSANVTDVQPLGPVDVGRVAIGHECFLADGRVAAVWMRVKRIGDGFSHADSGILIASPRTGRYAVHRAPGMVWNHLHGRDGRVFVSEGSSRVHLGRRNDAGLDLLCRYDVRGRGTRVTPLCRTGCTWQGQLGHPHPVLDRGTRAGRWAYFNSDAAGCVNVYRVRL